MAVQIPSAVREIIERAEQYNTVAIIIGFRGTELLDSILVFRKDEQPPRPPREISEEISALEDRNGQPLCIVASKEYEPKIFQFIAIPWRDFADDLWAGCAFQSYIENGIDGLVEDGAKIQYITPSDIH